MLSDRPYMREDYQRERTSFLVWFLCAIVAGFIVQSIASVWLNSGAFQNLIALTASGLKQFAFWQLFTYPLLHAGPLHLLFTGLGIFFIGRELTAHVGDRRLMWFTVAATVIGGLVWFAVNHARGGDLVGATSILFAYLILFGCLFPNREISFLIFFVIPVTTRPKYVAWACVAIGLFGFLFSELPGRSLGAHHSAHLGAMAAAWLYYRYFLAGDFTFSRPSIELPKWMQRSKKSAPAPAYKVNVSTPPPSAAAPVGRSDLRAEVDRILDKINAKGFGSLTPEEKRVLDSARDTLSRR